MLLLALLERRSALAGWSCAGWSCGRAGTGDVGVDERCDPEIGVHRLRRAVDHRWPEDVVARCKKSPEDHAGRREVHAEVLARSNRNTRREGHDAGWGEIGLSGAAGGRGVGAVAVVPYDSESEGEVTCRGVYAPGGDCARARGLHRLRGEVDDGLVGAGGNAADGGGAAG